MNTQIQPAFPCHLDNDFDGVDHCLFLIDDERKCLINGELHICTNPAHDLWVPLRMLSLSKLREIAALCVADHARMLGQTPDTNFKGTAANDSRFLKPRSKE